MSQLKADAGAILTVLKRDLQTKGQPASNGVDPNSSQALRARLEVALAAMQEGLVERDTEVRWVADQLGMVVLPMLLCPFFSNHLGAEDTQACKAAEGSVI